MSDVIATNAAAGDDPLRSIMGVDLSQIGASIQRVSNDIAALSAQNDDIAHGRWTLNNAVYQFQQLSPASQTLFVAGAVYLLSTWFSRHG